MSDFPKFVQINEEGPREGFQFEKGPISTERKLELIDALSETGLNHIQVASFVNPNRVPGWADADEVVQRYKRKPGILGQAGGEGLVTMRLHLVGAAQLAAGGGAIAAGDVVAGPDVEHGVAGQPQADHAREQRRHLGEWHRLGAALGQVGAERVVEATRGRGGAPRELGPFQRLRLGPRIAAAEPEADAGGQVARAVAIGIRERDGERRGRAARPEQQPSTTTLTAQPSATSYGARGRSASPPGRGC